jgi:C-terminal processing protease CtpA/Prc
MMYKWSAILLFVFFPIILSAQPLTTKQFKEDFDYFWTTIKTDYCYWDKKQTDWGKAKNTYSARADTITTRYSFVMLMETMFHELYDHHSSLSTNTNESSKLVPSGTDVWAEYINDKPIITAVRLNSGADKAGIKAGMRVLAINKKPVDAAVQPFLAKSVNKMTREAKDYALRIALAGTHSQKRVFTLLNKQGSKEYHPDDFTAVTYSSDIESKIISGVGYIGINNSLGNNGLIPMFDSVIDSLQHTKAIILDLRETPSGGNTTVARAIMSRFITKAGYYQKHELTAEETEFGVKRQWIEIVSPRKTAYTKPLIVLVNRWTGSVGEGITIGFDALKRATIIGTPMAGLNGAVYSYRMPNTGIGFSFPVEKLFHVNGTPREAFKPTVIVTETGRKDAILETALTFITKMR